MITGIQITKAANDDLLNSSGCWTAKKAKRAASLQNWASLSKTFVLRLAQQPGEIEYREIPMEAKLKYALKAVSIRTHNRLRVVKLWKMRLSIRKKYPQLTIRVLAMRCVLTPDAGTAALTLSLTNTESP